jgi:hypothetical protein
MMDAARRQDPDVGHVRRVAFDAFVFDTLKVRNDRMAMLEPFGLGPEQDVVSVLPRPDQPATSAHRRHTGGCTGSILNG